MTSTELITFEYADRQVVFGPMTEMDNQPRGKRFVAALRLRLIAILNGNYIDEKSIEDRLLQARAGRDGGTFGHWQICEVST